MRIASLLPAGTDIVCALGRADDLVGVTFECSPPDGVLEHAQVIVGGRDTSAMAPREVDAYVREQVRLGADLYTLHRDALADARPDVVLTQDLCRVCALPAGAVGDALRHLGCQADVVTLDPHSLDDVFDTIKAVGAAIGALDEAAGLVSALRRRLAVVAELVASRPRPRVAVIEWLDPVFGAGHWIPDLVRAAGGEPVACRPHQRSVPISWDDVRRARPEVAVVAPCGYDLAGAAAQAASALAELPGVAVWAMDADAVVVRAGPGLVDGVEAFAGALHPQVGLASAPWATLVRA